MYIVNDKLKPEAYVAGTVNRLHEVLITGWTEKIERLRPMKQEKVMGHIYIRIQVQKKKQYYQYNSSYMLLIIKTIYINKVLTIGS